MPVATATEAGKPADKHDTACDADAPTADDDTAPANSEDATTPDADDVATVDEGNHDADAVNGITTIEGATRPTDAAARQTNLVVHSLWIRNIYGKPLLTARDGHQYSFK